MYDEEGQWEKNNAIQNNGNLASIVKIITSDNADEEVS
jgi:hypothetical protein